MTLTQAGSACRKMPDYQQGKIYCIKSKETSDVYIGSTCQNLNSRMSRHKSNLKNNINYSVSDILKYEDAYIELIEKYPCNNKKELCKREGEFIKNTKNCINKNIAGRTVDEYMNENRDYILNKKKQYYKENKEILNKYRKEKFDCDCGGKYVYRDKASHIKTKKHLNYLESNKQVQISPNTLEDE